jgi:hypothetical protein
LIAVPCGSALSGKRHVGHLLRHGRVAQAVGLDEAHPAGAQDGDGEEAEEDREEEADATLRQRHI